MIGNAVLVGVDGATGGVDRNCHWPLGALVEVVGKSVLVGIDGATRRVDGDAGRSFGAFIEVVGDSVHIGIADDGGFLRQGVFHLAALGLDFFDQRVLDRIAFYFGLFRCGVFN